MSSVRQNPWTSFTVFNPLNMCFHFSISKTVFSLPVKKLFKFSHNIPCPPRNHLNASNATNKQHAKHFMMKMTRYQNFVLTIFRWILVFLILPTRKIGEKYVSNTLNRNESTTTSLRGPTT